MGNKCDHIIAYYQRDSFIVLSELLPVLLKLVKKLENNAKMTNALGLWAKEKESYELIEFLDGRKGHMVKFKFCPDCGERIDWKSIKRDLKKIEKPKSMSQQEVDNLMNNGRFIKQR